MIKYIFLNKIIKFKTTVPIIIACFSIQLVHAQFVPELIYPNSNEVTNQSTITFKWNKVFYPNTVYNFQFSDTFSFSNVLVDATTSANWHTINSIAESEQYYFWRVRSIQSGVLSNWSEIDSFLVFNPASIPGLAVWLDPNNGAVLNGSNVQSMDDFASNGNAAVQSVPIQRPFFVSSDSLINNKSTIKYDGVDDFMQIADNSSIDFTDAISMFVLVRPTIIATNKTIMAKWDYQTQGSWAFQTDFSFANQLMFAPCFNITDPGIQKIYSTDANMQALKPSLLNLVYNGQLVNKVRMYKNTQLLNTTTLNTLPSNLPNSTATLKIGKYGGIATRYYQGDIGEMLIYNTELTPPQKSKVDNYLRYKYAPPVSLGCDTLLSGNSFCGSIQLKAQYKFQSYTWSTGSTASSITATSPGTYWVTVTDFLGNISSDTIVVHPPFNVNKPVTSGLLCAGDTLTWSTNYSASDFTFLWQDDSIDSVKNITQAGNYAVAISDLFGCVYYSDTLSISMDNFPLTATLGNDTTLCAGNLISLQVGASETVNYFWNGTSTIAQSPFLSVNTSGTYTLEAINTNSCIAKDTIGVIVSGQAPLADFAFASEFVCLGIPISFVDESAPIGSDFIVQWNWSMGNGVALSGQNQNYEFPAPGTYTVQLYVESVGGCGAFHWDTLEVFANPTAAFTSVGHCSGQDVVFTSASYANGAPLSAHYWSFGMQPPNDPINFSTLQEAMRTYLSAGSYTVSLLVTDTNSCTDEALATLVIDPTPIVQFAVEDACVAAEVPFTDESTTANFSTYLWDFGNNGTSLLTNPITSYATPGSRTVSLVITSPEGCVGTRQESLMVHDNPVAEMDLGPYCKGTYTDVSDISTVLDGSIASSYWIFNQVDTVYGSDVHYIFQTLGQQQIVLNTISNYGCKTTLNEFIEVTAELNAAFGVGTGTTAAGAPFNFTNLSTGSAIYLWNFGDNTISNAVAPEHTYGEAYIDSSLQVALYALNVEGCVDTAYQTILIERAKIDLELSYLYVQKQNDWNIIGVKMTNRGTTPLKKIQLFLETDKGFLFQETWTGDLKPLEDTIYVFGAKPVASITDQNVEESFVCVNAIGYDLFQEEETILWNNYLCRNIEGENVILKPVYPNPVHGEMTVELIVSKDSEVSIQLFDATGKTAITLLPEQVLSEGNYSYTVNTAHLSSGTYFLRMVTKENVVMEKISFQ